MNEDKDLQKGVDDLKKAFIKGGALPPAWVAETCATCEYAFFNPGDTAQGLCREGPPTPVLLPQAAPAVRVLGARALPPAAQLQIGSSYSVVSPPTMACGRWVARGGYAKSELTHEGG